MRRNRGYGRLSGDLGFLLRGLVLGFSIAAPVGPIGVLCIRRTRTEGPAIGLAFGALAVWRAVAPQVGAR